MLLCVVSPSRPSLSCSLESRFNDPSVSRQPRPGGVVVIKVSQITSQTCARFRGANSSGYGNGRVRSVSLCMLCVLFGDACEPGQVRSGRSFGSGLFATVMEIGRDEHHWMPQSTGARG